MNYGKHISHIFVNFNFIYFNIVHHSFSMSDYKVWQILYSFFIEISLSSKFKHFPRKRFKV